MDPKIVWLIIFVLVYWGYCIYWGVKGAIAARTASDYMLTSRSIPLWVFVLAATATSFLRNDDLAIIYIASSTYLLSGYFVNTALLFSMATANSFFAC